MTNLPKSILVIQTAFIGDIIMSSPLFEGLKKIYPEATIDVVVNSKYTALLSNHPHIRKVYGFDKTSHKFLNLLQLILKLRKSHYDLAVSMQRHLSSSLMMVLGGVKKRVGSSKQKMLTHAVTFPAGIHNREKAGLLLKMVRKGTYDLQTRLYPSEKDKEAAGSLVRNNRRFKLGVAPGSVWETKKWPKEYYIEAINRMADEADIYLIGGGRDDIILCQEIVDKLDRPDIVNTAGQLSLLASAALIEQLDLLLCNDSAPLHMANAMKTPVFAFFGPTVKRFGCYPYQPNDNILEIDLYCRPCTKHGSKICPEGHFRCMKEIEPQRVVDEILLYMSER